MELVPIQRYVNHDNSCLFSTISYLIDKENFNESSSLIYRLTIVDYIKENTKITNDLLGMDKEEYISKIENPSCWGGAIELKIFSDILETQIASIDIQSGRIDIFGETKDFTKRIYVLYNGIHYDPLVMNSIGNEENLNSDITIFEPEDYDKLIKFKDLAEKLKSDGKFVDLNNINNYKCCSCNEQFSEEADVYIHAQNNNHWKFDEI
jgi:ubiquitin thioesterase OTU1